MKQKIKLKLARIAIWYLRKHQFSVIIGFDLERGKVKQKYNNAFTYDLDMLNVEYRNDKDKLFNIPAGQFNIKH